MAATACEVLFIGYLMTARVPPAELAEWRDMVLHEENDRALELGDQWAPPQRWTGHGPQLLQ
jgi:hypothetical protein